MSSRLFLFAVVLCAASIAAIHGVPIAGNTESNRHAQLKHLKEQFELFKKELDQVLSEGSSPVEDIPAPVAVVETDERCDCDDSTQQKRCPNGCGKKKTKPAVAVAEPATNCVRRCPTCECEGSARSVAVASGPAAIQDSPIMKRFLNVLPVKDQELIQHSGAKKQYIDRLIRRSHYGPNKEDMVVNKVATPEVSKAEERSPVPVEESSEMAAFKRGLNPQEQQLLKNHNSKAQAIRGLLERKVESAKKEITDPVVAEYVETLTEEEQLLLKAHPSSEDDLKEALEQGTNEEVPAATGKRQLSSSQIQDAINKLGDPSDRALAQKHLSKIQHLAEAENKPVGGEEEVAKRKLSAAQIEETINKLGDPNDRALAKNHISKMESLAKAETRPVGGEEEASVVVAKLFNEIRLAKKGGVSLEKVIEALKKRADSAKKPASLKQ